MSTPVSWLTSGDNKIACCIAPAPDVSDTPGSFKSDSIKSDSCPTVPNPTVVFCGGFKSNMQGTKALALQTLCSNRHWPFVRFDYSGHGQSEGDFTDGNIDHWLNDALTVVDSISNPQGIILVGSSMGAWIATLIALRRRDRIRGLVTIAAAPDFTERMLHERLDEKQLQTLKSGQPVNLPSEYDDGSPYPITLQLIENSRQHCLLSQQHTLAIPVRMLHGTKDIDVPYQTSIALMDALVCDDVQVTLIKDADHRLSSESDLKLLEATLIKLLT